MGRVKNILFALFALAVVALSVKTSLAIDGLPPGTDEALQELQATMYPPWVYEVKLDPPVPAAGQDITVTAQIYNDSSITRDKTIAATLMYSIDDGDNWEMLDMDEVVANNTWSAVIPAQDEGVEVLYGFRAEDTSSNIYTETPCLVTAWPPVNDSCMFEIAVDEAPVDDESSLIPDSFDIQGFKAGVDDDNLFVEISLDGTVSEGTISPIFVHLYGFGVANPDKGDPSDIISQGFLGVYAPSADAFTYLPCMTVFEKGDEAVFSNTYIKCATDGKSRLWFKVNNKQIGNTPSGYLKMMAADGAITSITPLAGVPYDYTHVTTLALFDRWFTVQ